MDNSFATVAKIYAYRGIDDPHTLDPQRSTTKGSTEGDRCTLYARSICYCCRDAPSTTSAPPNSAIQYNKGKRTVEHERQNYHIYLLTVWQEFPDASGPHWRFRLVDPQTGEDCGFVTPQALPFVLQQLQRGKSLSSTLYKSSEKKGRR